jgi:hypothetical protein
MRKLYEIKIQCSSIKVFGVFKFVLGDLFVCLFVLVGWWVFGFFDTGSHYVAQTGLKLVILLPQPSQHWDYSCVLLYALL